jgi:hypothetical protein
MGSASGPLRLRMGTSGVKLNKIARQKPSGQWILNGGKTPRVDRSVKFEAARMGTPPRYLQRRLSPAQRQPRVLRETAHSMSRRICISMISRSKILMLAEKTYGQADVFIGIMRVG